MPDFIVRNIIILITLCFLMSYANLLFGQDALLDRDSSDLIIADFENIQANAGNIFIWADLEPDWEDLGGIYSWIYEPAAPDFDPENVYSGVRSLRLVNGLGKYQDLGWGVASITLGSISGLKPALTINTFDGSRFKFLSIWVKPVQPDIRFRVFLKDSDCNNYMGELIYTAENLQKDAWQKIIIDLSNIGKKIDMDKLTTINISFSKEEKNLNGHIMYIDDIGFVE